MHASGSGGRAWSAFYICFRFSIFPERGAVGKMLGGSLQSAAALLVCMAASPEDKRVGICALQPSEFSGATGGG